MSAQKKSKPNKAYAFIDTNIFLDFYRSRNETSLSLLGKLERVKDRVICSYQVEMEFLKNRQAAILDNSPGANLTIDVQLPAVMDDSQLSSALKKEKKNIEKRKRDLQKRIINVIGKPSVYDPIYKILRSIFDSAEAHVLTRDMKIRHQIKRLAWRRFILGYPPRKGKDNSIGDAMNWEWFIHCANELQGKFLIVSRDSDYGIEYRDMPFLNDALKAEFRDRVGKKSILYTTKLSDALKHLEVTVSREEEESEDAQLESTSRSTTGYAALKKVYDDISLLQTSMGVERPSKAWRNLLEQTTPAADAIKRFREQMKVLEENFAPSIEAINKLREQHPELFVKPKGADETDS